MKPFLHAMLVAAMVFAFQVHAIAADDAKAKKEVLQIKLTPAKGAPMAPYQADLIAQGEKTRIAVMIARTPEGLANPLIIATVYKGGCGDAGKTKISAFDSKTTNPTAPGGPAGVGVSFEGVVPASLSTLKSGPYSIGLATSPADGNKPLACGEVK